MHATVCSSATKRERPLCDQKGQSPPTVNLAREIHSWTREFHRRLIQHQRKQELGKQQQPVFTSHQRLLSLQQKKNNITSTRQIINSPAPESVNLRYQYQFNSTRDSRRPEPAAMEKKNERKASAVEKQPVNNNGRPKTT